MYNNREEQERDNQIIGEKTPRYLIGNYINHSRLGEDIKVFAKHGDYGDLKNVTAYGLFSSKYGIFVEPSLNLRFNQGRVEENQYIENAGTLAVGFMGDMELKPGFEEGSLYSPGAYYYPNQKWLNDIKYEEVEEVLNYVIKKANGNDIEAISSEELFEVLSKIRGLDLNEENGMKR